jgi:hypothetical protein
LEVNFKGYGTRLEEEAHDEERTHGKEKKSQRETLEVMATSNRATRYPAF